MKTSLPRTLRLTILIVASALHFAGAIRSAGAAEKTPETEFPYVIEIKLGAVEFAPGDRIVIGSVRGDRDHLVPGGRYLLNGSYTLASAEQADLAWFSTMRGPSGATPITDDQHVIISKGSGNFHLEKNLSDDGWLHVSFYVDGHSHGGVYFGENGFEKTVLQDKGWSDFPAVLEKEKGGAALRSPADDWAKSSAGNNRSLMAYLGDPVRPPDALSPDYSPIRLLENFAAMSKKGEVHIKKLAVDASEFPFLVYGILEGANTFGAVEKELRQAKVYGYNGSVVGNTGDGATYFSLNMIPRDQCPAGQAVACNRRLMVRLQMLADSMCQEK